MLVATPGLATDLARLGPVEPMLVAGMGCGLALALASTRRLLERGRPRALWLAAFVAGYALWLLGVYQKEASICALALFPFLYLVLDRRWRAAGVIAAPLYRSKGFLIAGCLLVLPLLHMMYEITQVTADGETVYGTDVPHRHRRMGTRLWDSAEFAVDLLAAARHVRVAGRGRRSPVPAAGVGVRPPSRAVVAAGTACGRIRRLSLSGSGRGARDPLLHPVPGAPCHRRRDPARRRTAVASARRSGHGGALPVAQRRQGARRRRGMGERAEGRHRRGRRGRAPGPGTLPGLHGTVPCRGRRLVPRARRARAERRRAQTVRPAIQGHHDPGSPPASPRYQRGHLRNLRRPGMGEAQNDARR